MRSLSVLVLVLTFIQSAGLCQEQKKEWPFTPVQSRQPPVVKNSAWVSNEIDRFILARLESSGLAPAGDASKRALVRRLYFDLIGLQTE